MAEDQFKSFAKVSCVCGAQLRVDPASPNRHVACPTCGNVFDFVVNMDTAKKRSKVSIVLSRAAMKTEGESLGKGSGEKTQKSSPEAPPARSRPSEYKPKVTKVTKKVGGKTTRIVMGNCECGATFPLEDTGELATLQSCPQCNTSYHVVFKIEPGTDQKTAMLVSEKPKLPKSRTIAVRQLPSQFPPGESPSPDDLRVTDFFTPGKKGRTKVPKTKISSTKVKTVTPKSSPEIPPGAQGVPCDCGTLFVVRRKDLGNEMTCEGCGEKVSFEEARDPQTLAPILRVRKS